jgi:hypothetical protein
LVIGSPGRYEPVLTIRTGFIALPSCFAIGLPIA